jgi:hypothetical protein
MTSSSLPPQAYQGLGNSLEEAVKAAHAKIPIRTGRDFVVCRVLQWGYQRGGFVDAQQFYALVVENDLPGLLS